MYLYTKRNKNCHVFCHNINISNLVWLFIVSNEQMTYKTKMKHLVKGWGRC